MRKTKVCKGLCGLEKDVSEFYKGKLKCKECYTPYAGDSLNAKSWKKANKCKVLAQKVRWRIKDNGDSVRKSNLKKFGMTQQDYDDILHNQRGVCKICGVTPSIVKRLSVDHCHETGIVRGLLCGACNPALGMMRDNVSILQSAIAYLIDAKNPSGKIFKLGNRVTTIEDLMAKCLTN